MVRILLCLLLGLVLGAAEMPSAWLESPVLVANDRALRLDVQTRSILLRAQVVKLIACSAVDQPIVAYAEDAALSTGCWSPGFTQTQVFPLPAGVNASTGVVDHFAVRQRARSLYLRRRLLDPHSPSVWLQATLEVRNERGVVVETLVDAVRFQVVERALPIGATVPPNKDAGSTIADTVLRLLHLRGDSEINAVVLDYDEMDGREDLHNGTSTRFYNHVHWSTYSAIMMGALFACVLLVAGVLRFGRGRGHTHPHSDTDDDSSSTKSYVARRTDRLGAWLRSPDVQALYHNEDESDMV